MSDAYKGAEEQRDLLATQLADLQAKYKDLLANAGPSLPKPINDALQQLADQYPDLLEYDVRLGMLRFKSDMTFDLVDRCEAAGQGVLEVFAGILNNPLIAKNEVRIVGHTDDVPIRASSTMAMNPTNWFLSTNRAHLVREVRRRMVWGTGGCRRRGGRDVADRAECGGCKGTRRTGVWRCIFWATKRRRMRLMRVRSGRGRRRGRGRRVGAVAAARRRRRQRCRRCR